MKNITYLFLTISFLSCTSKQTGEKSVDEVENETTEVADSTEYELIIGERIDGTANVRNEPNGEILFELYDNVLVGESSKPENDWYEILIIADINYKEYGLDSILKDRPIIVGNDTVGRVLNTHSVNTGQGGDFAFARLYGFTHKNNIKPETVIETAFIKELSQSDLKLNSWKDFIRSFDLDTNAIIFNGFQTYYNYENSFEDPSPGFRMVLLFENDNLIGLLHSRDLRIDDTKMHKLDESYMVTFFNEYPERKQIKFFDYMNEWIKRVD